MHRLTLRRKFCACKTCIGLTPTRREIKKGISVSYNMVYECNEYNALETCYNFLIACCDERLSVGR